MGDPLEVVVVKRGASGFAALSECMPSSVQFSYDPAVSPSS